MQKRAERTDEHMHVWKAFYNLSNHGLQPQTGDKNNSITNQTSGAEMLTQTRLNNQT